MILKELVDLARREGLVEDLDYEPRPVRWVVAIGEAGKFFEVFEPSNSVDGKKPRPKSIAIPRQPGRTSGSMAHFPVDKLEYALGFDPDDNPKKHAKLAHHRALFREYVGRAAALAPGDRALVALLRFLADDGAVAGAIAGIGGGAASNDLVAFRFEDDDEGTCDLIHDREAVREAWQALRHERAGPAESDHPACLSCGAIAPAVDTHPQIRRVPGGTTSGIALVSANAAAFESLGLDQAGSAPVCRACADAYGTALNRLFHPEQPGPDGIPLPRRSVRLSDDTAVVY